MIDFESRILEVKFNGQLIVVRYPVLFQSRAYVKKLKDLPEDVDKIDALIDFLDELGLKKEYSDKMEMWQIEKIAEELLKGKK